MPILFLHIGSGKTGTSALQVAFAKNAAKLRQHGVVYPDSPSNRHAAKGLITSGNAFGLATRLDPRLKLNAGNADFIAAVKRELRKARGCNVLYSSEFLSGFNQTQMTQLIALADAEGYSTKIVFYVRSIAAHAYSTYTQAVKRQGYTGAFSEFLPQYKNRFVDTIQRAETAVSRGNLLVRNYEAAQNGIFRDFLEGVLKIDQADGFEEVATVNRSLSPFEIEFVRCMNGMFDKRYQSVFTSDSLIYADPELKERHIVSEKEKAFLDEKFAETVAIVNGYIAGQGIAVVDESVEIGTRPVIHLSDFERCMMSVIARLVPAAPVKESSAAEE